MAQQHHDVLDTRQFALPPERRSGIQAFKAYVTVGSEGDTDASIFWSMKDILICLAPVAHNKHGTTYAHRCWKHRKERALKILEEFNTPANAVRESLKAATARARASSSTGHSQESEDAGGAHHHEHQSCTTEALLLLLVHWAEGSKRLDERSTASDILQDFLQCQLSNATHGLSVDRLFFTMLDDLGCPDAHAQGAEAHCCHMSLVADPAVLEQEAHWPQVEALLLSLFKHRAACERVMATAMAYFQQLASVIDKSILDPALGRGKGDPLPSPRGQKRARHIDKGLRDWVLAKVKEKRYRSAADALRGQAMGHDERTARDMEEHDMREYMWSCAHLGSQTVHWCIAKDESRLGGEDTSMYAAWLPKFNKGFWMVPQASGKSFREFF
jgi:hypothetical protein